MCNLLQIYNSYMIRANYQLNSKKGEHKMKKDGPLIWSNDLSQIMTTLQTRRLIREMNRKSPHFHRKPQSESESLSQQINQTNIWSTIRGGSLNEKVFGHQETLYLLAMVARYTFFVKSQHKNSCGLCFWTSDPLIERFQ